MRKGLLENLRSRISQVTESADQLHLSRSWSRRRFSKTVGLFSFAGLISTIRFLWKTGKPGASVESFPECRACAGWSCLDPDTYPYSGQCMTYQHPDLETPGTHCWCDGTDLQYLICDYYDSVYHNYCECQGSAGGDYCIPGPS